MKPKTERPEPLRGRPAHWPRLQALFTDLDDTLTTDGLLPSAVVAELERLHAGGLRLVIATGRSAGWADALVRLLPVDAVVFETGGGTVTRDGRGRFRTTLAAKPDGLAALARQFLRRFPDLRPADDQRYRLTDFAVDIAENRRVPERRVAEALAWLRARPGVSALASSVHINFWRGAHSKATGCAALLRRWKLDAGAVVVCGDAPNDESLFERFPESVGLQNLAPRLGELRHAPRYLHPRPRSAGFCDLARILLPR